MKTVVAKSIDEYISLQQVDKRPILEKLRIAIKKAAPKAEELISYQMPAFKYHGILCYFALNKNHIGFYPTPSTIEAFIKDLTNYKCSKGAVQFQLSEPIPYDLVTKMVKYKVIENESKISNKKGKYFLETYVCDNYLS